jgi:hypothetical protein
MEIIVLTLLMLAITVAANYALQERERRLHYAVVVALALVNAVMLVLSVMLLLIGLAPEGAEAILDAEIKPLNTLAAAGVFTATALLATALLFDGVRDWLARWLPEREARALPAALPQSEVGGLMMTSDGQVMMPPLSLPEPLPEYRKTPANAGFDPGNTVHMVALVFCVYLLGNQLGNFVLSGGLSGVADELRVTWVSLLLNFIPQIVVPSVGAGLLIRRTWSQWLERMGLARFTWESVAIGVGAAIGFYVFLIGAVIVWSLIVPVETLEEQTEASRAIGESINTIWLALAVALTAGIGEELAFRGALQPILGFWGTAILFTLTHIQYTLTPAALIIFGVALGLGWLRNRYNLYAAITAHFLYNFIQLALTVLFNA